MPLLVPIEQAAINALAAWLRANLPSYDASAQSMTGLQGVKVSDHWPDGVGRLPERAITILLAGQPREEITQPEVERYDVIHAAVSTALSVPSITSDAAAIIALNAARASYEAHRVSTSAHASADTTNAVTAPTASDQASAIVLATDLIAVGAAHYSDAAHTTIDSDTTLARLGTVTAANLWAATRTILRDLNRHYTARLYTWRISDMERPVQLDVWTTREPWRDDLHARLEPLLNVGTLRSAGIGGDDPTRNGVLVALGDGWTGAYADFDFDPLERREDEGAVQKDEFRLMARGTMHVFRLIKAQSPRLADITVELSIVGNTATDGIGQLVTSTADPGYTESFT